MLLALTRTILVIILFASICVLGLIYCLFSPRDPKHVATFGRLFSSLAPIFGIKIKVILPKNIILPHKCIYIANHQNFFDIITLAYVIQPFTVTVGKKSLLWIPIFGQLYWLTGNLLINRNNSISAHNFLNKLVHKIKNTNISILFFPEGTRNQGLGLLPFKTGAFYTAIAARVPIVPICVSNITDKIKLNRWYNGIVLIEILPPIDTNSYSDSKKHISQLTIYCRQMMKSKIDELNAEVTKY
ncbi:1-acylglycerol-3-phosphate O-acyltransferase [Candidatus Palibaumannia cicadellinicola]|uniref:1-acyl-sn-glycerol-3-phosphate acyltransferase n=1 Tax=Candidatus Palibaumannia cicadellinicola TaxID=186490 RepID=A0A0K2BLE4_9GAMM|nr:1-acylglycerol-3-phosphate O-acyltransferase [Candidatus Baumannia cicadellinicola]AKZ66145.1 1-acyl-sn-glycerol-3-phosphate acyltransferase [Candidatus Baumannia cicadellinicola]